VELERYKTESLQAQLQNLKNQINPHFLFNNLSVLSSLVYKDQDKAVDFINQLSKVYRYLLDNRTSELIRLDEELAFIASYTNLIQIRFGESIHFKIAVGADFFNKMIPPLALQILIENVIKHNELSPEHPMTVYLTAKGNTLEVKNRLQPRINTEQSTGTGLQNIRERYRFFTGLGVEVQTGPENFSVTIPLLNAS